VGLVSADVWSELGNVVFPGAQPGHVIDAADLGPTDAELAAVEWFWPDGTPIHQPDPKDIP
jgi:hypothetical protein